MSTLNKAVAIAYQAHENQVDKSGEPYILHPMRLASKFDHSDLKTIALLHDVVEDSNITVFDLEKMGFSFPIIEAILCLTKRSTKSYDDFIQRVNGNILATQVKIEDLKDNLNICRLKTQLSEDDLERICKYHKAYLQLISKL